MACLKGVVDLADAVAEDVGEAQQDRQLDAAGLELIDQLLEVDRLVGAFVRVDGDVARLVDAEIAFAPVANAVGFDGVLDLSICPSIPSQRLSASRKSPKGSEKGARGGKMKDRPKPLGDKSFAL